MEGSSVRERQFSVEIMKRAASVMQRWKSCDHPEKNIRVHEASKLCAMIFEWSLKTSALTCSEPADEGELQRGIEKVDAKIQAEQI